ncbi:MAG: type VI secretion system-associated protein TagF [Novosphingobium sp.]|nr:type VI secretion system-associated protein TagF [Novosphingobium sp.]
MSTWSIFGKLPAHGDFVARGMDMTRREACDAWLTTSFEDAQERFSDDWRERFDCAPPWLYVHPLSDGFEAGALCPSVDRAGRRFPLLASVETGGGENLAALAVQAQEALYRAISSAETVDELMASLAQLAVADAPNVTPPQAIDSGCWWAIDADGEVVASLPLARPANLLSEMLALSQVGADHAT